MPAEEDLGKKQAYKDYPYTLRLEQRHCLTGTPREPRVASLRTYGCRGKGLASCHRPLCCSLGLLMFLLPKGLGKGQAVRGFMFETCSGGTRTHGRTASSRTGTGSPDVCRAALWVTSEEPPFGQSPLYFSASLRRDVVTELACTKRTVTLGPATENASGQAGGGGE